MRIIIEHSKTKREIKGSFNICGTPADLRRMATQILDGIGETPGKSKFNYGWVAVTEPHPNIVDTEPVGWDDDAK